MPDQPAARGEAVSQLLCLLLAHLAILGDAARAQACGARGLLPSLCALMRDGSALLRTRELAEVRPQRPQRRGARCARP
jgi:hypothetical protein